MLPKNSSFGFARKNDRASENKEGTFGMVSGQKEFWKNFKKKKKIEKWKQKKKFECMKNWTYG